MWSVEVEVAVVVAEGVAMRWLWLRRRTQMLDGRKGCMGYLMVRPSKGVE